MAPDSALQDRVLVFAPTGRDGALAARAIAEAGMPALVCADLQVLLAELERGAASVVITEEALAPGPRARLSTALERQPVWSDLPVIVCAGRPESAGARGRLAALAAELGNATLLERPIHPDALVGNVVSALRARRRQYQSRELLSRLETAVLQREQFLATLSHELRNPLGAIRNAVALMTRQRLCDGRAERPIAVIDRQSGHLGRLVDDLLDVARVTTGKVTLRRRSLDLRDILDNVAAQLAPTIQQHGLRFTCTLDPDPCLVDGDPTRLEQVLSNLLTNAIKYTPQGGRVAVTLARENQTAKIQVRDSGVGMAPDTLAVIFDLFSQADRSLDRAQGGMGIGLTLVRALTELHGGTVSAASPGLGQGSEFTVTFPLIEPAQPAVRPAAAPQPIAPRHILIVEDSADNREMLQALLEYEGHHVEVASDGIEAVRAAARSRPEVALIDIGLPGIDGYEVARRMRAGLGHDIVLVALTGYGRPEDRQRSAEAGFDTHITKPPELSELQAALARRTAVDAGRSGAANRPLR